MVRSRLPVPSLLGLFGALLMLSPELLLGMPGRYSKAPVIDPMVQKLLSFTRDQYNDRGDGANYFKVLRFSKDVIGMEHQVLVEMAETTCKKKPGLEFVYENVQKCELLPGKNKLRVCYFKISPPTPPKESLLALVVCALVKPQ